MADAVEEKVAIVQDDKASQEPPMMEEDEKETAAEEVKEERTEEETPEPARVDIEGVEQLEDGTFTYTVDPDNPKSTVYKDSTLKGLFSKVRAGTKEKDTYIHKLRSEQLSADSHRGLKPEAEDPSGFPNWGEVLTSTAKEYGVDPLMASWDDTKWAEYADEKGMRDFAVTRLQQRVEKVNEIAQARYNEGNVIAINDQGLDDETEQVKALVAAVGVSEEFTPDVYRDILTTVMDNKDNFKRGGVRKNGVIVSAAAKEIARLVSVKKSTEMKKKADEDIASGKLRKDKLPTDGPSKKDLDKTTSKPPKTFNEARDQLLAELAAGKHKNAFTE